MSGVVRCTACCVIVATTPEVHRGHYNSQWHRFNVKRKVVGLPPVAEKTFLEKVPSLNDSPPKDRKHSNELYLRDRDDPASDSNPNQTNRCIECNKNYSTQNGLLQHLRSKRHATVMSTKKIQEEAQKDIQKAEDSEEQEADSASEISVEDNMQVVEEETEDASEDNQITAEWTPDHCLFCRLESEDLESNVEHMAKDHGLFIPEIEYLLDLEDLLRYLADKILVNHICLYCNERGKVFQSAEAVQNHMVSRNHCKLEYDGREEEFAHFYDFSSGYEEFEKMTEQLEKKLLLEGPVPVSGEKLTEEEKRDELALAKLDAYAKSNIEVSPDGLSLTFRSGKVIGHRDLQIYYRQNIKPGERRESIRITQIANQYKMLGYVARRSPTYSDPKAEKLRIASRMRLGVKANKLQHHFRYQVEF